jgi:hypothetical protein
VQLVLEDLATSDGPDLRVWLTDQPVLEGRDGWFVFDDGRVRRARAAEGEPGQPGLRRAGRHGPDRADQRDDLVQALLGLVRGGRASTLRRGDDSK